MNVKTQYKKFKNLNDLYTYISKIEPNMDNWGCVGQLSGNQFDTRVWPSEWGGGKNGFFKAFKYVSENYLNGTDFEQGVAVQLDVLGGTSADGDKISGGYVQAYKEQHGSSELKESLELYRIVELANIKK